MPWFWGGSKEDEEEEEDDSSSYESYESGEEDESYEDDDQDVTSFAEESAVEDQALVEIPAAAPVTGDTGVAVVGESENQQEEEQPEGEEHDDAVSLPNVPPKLVGSSAHRIRLDSGITFGEGEDGSSFCDDDDDEEAEDGGRVETKEPKVENEEEKKQQLLVEEEEVTSWQEKIALLTLAAEHDRVDILQTILESEEERNELLFGTTDTTPPLHTAVAHGAVNATNALLRIGAPPHVRPTTGKYKGCTAWNLLENKATKIPLSKVSSLRHAFCAEALRCLGGDLEKRLHELLEAGLPVENVMGDDKSLAAWAADMGAQKCLALLGSDSDENIVSAKEQQQQPTSPRGTVRRGALDGRNRLDELESLAQALGSCLDNLGEEVAVASGLLLLGSGAAALASHVKSLKAQKIDKEDALERWKGAYENTNDELIYWASRCGAAGREILSEPVRKADTIDDDDNMDETQLHAAIAASENKIRLLRVSIADLSDENSRNLAAVEKRGLQGGVNLVRNLREEIRTIEFQIAELQSAEAEDRTKLALVQEKIRLMEKNGELLPSADGSKPATAAATSQSSRQAPGLASYDESSRIPQTAAGASSQEQAPSTAIETGQSTALALRAPGQRGFFPVSLWQILLRIIGMGDDSNHANNHSVPHSIGSMRGASKPQPAMIV